MGQRIPTATTASAPRRGERSTEERAEKRQNAPQGSGKHPHEKHRQKGAVGTRSEPRRVKAKALLVFFSILIDEGTGSVEWG